MEQNKNSEKRNEKQTSSVKLLDEVIKIKPLDNDISKFVDKHFWELV